MNKIVTRCLRGLLLLSLVSRFLMADQGAPSPEGIAGPDSIGGASGEGLAWADSQHVNFNWNEIADGVPLPSSVNDTSYAVTLPFTFYFYNKPFSTIYVSNNGYLTFHNYQDSTYAQNDSLKKGQSPDSLIAVFWDDFDPISPSSGQIYYKTVGSSPFRRFIVEYRNVTLVAGTEPLTFQVILYESINIFKFQYLKLGDLTPLYQGNSATVGVRYSKGIFSDSLIYSVNKPNLYDSLAVLFFPSNDLSASFGVTPVEVTAGTYFQQFGITISNLRLQTGTTDSLQEMGKADYVRINNPFNSDNVILTAVSVDGQSYFYQQSNSVPTEPGHATYYNGGSQDLIVQVPAFAVKNTITVGFVLNNPIPTTPGDYIFSTEILPRLNQNAASSHDITVTVKAAGVSHYTFSPAIDTVIAAGNSISYTLKALDVFGNGVVNNGSVNLTAIGSDSAMFNPSSTVFFSNDSVLTFSVSDTKKESFSIRAVNASNSNITGQSNLITVTPAAPDHFTILSSSSPIIVGTSRLLVARLEDQYANTIGDSDVTFQLISGRDGEFSNGQDSITVTTNSNGNAEATYTASTLTSYGSDSIRVRIGSVTADIVLPLLSGPIGFFDLTILDALPDTAGSSIRIRVVARDVYGNPVVNSASYMMSAIGSNTAQFIPSNTYTFSNDSADTAIVRDTVVEIFSVKAQLVGSPNKQGTSPAIQIIPASLDYLLLRSRAGNKGDTLSGVDTTISSSETITFYAAGYDQFGNYRDDIDSSLWGSNGTLTHTGTFPVTASSYNFNPAAAGTGQIFISIPGKPAIASDTTGTITVTSGQLAYIRIQSDPSAGGAQVNNKTFVAGDTLTMYAVGYDVDNNWLGMEPSNWMVNNSTLGVFQNGLDTINNVSQVVFTARKVGNGVVSAEAVSNSSIDDQTGLFTVNGGAPNYILIRSEANNGGFVYGDSPPLSVSADSSIKLYAAHYDAFGNYLGESSVNWGSSGLIGVPTGPAPSIVFSPTLISSGIIFTSSSITDDSTNTITVVHGKLAHIHIQNGPTASAAEVGSVTLRAGEDTTLYAGGYDNDDNFISLISSNWSLQGDSIGTFSTPNPATVDTLTGKFVGTAVVRAVDAAGGVIADFTSSVTVTQGDPASISKIASTDNQVGTAGQDLPRDIEVKVLDSFGNPVENDTVRFKPLAGGAVNGNTGFADVRTNALGIASVTWTLHSDTTTDSVSAKIPGYATTPDSVIFHATSTAGTAVTMSIFSADTLTGTVNTDLTLDFEVLVEDSSGNPAPNVTVSFAIVNQPIGAQNASLTDYSVQTSSSGIASTTLHLGTKVGPYEVKAFAATQPASVSFYGIANQAASPDTIIVTAGKNQTGTVGQQLADSIRFKVTDQYGNINLGVTINVSALDGSANPASGTTDANGFFATAWTLGNISGPQQLVASLPSFSVVSDTVNATALPGAADSLALFSMRNLPYDSVAAVPGENITFVVKAFDAYGNLKPNTTVRFAPQPGYNVFFESNQLVTNDSGRVTNVVKTDADTSETFFRAFIAGVDTLPLHIFHILYVLKSLQDTIVSPGQNVAFRLQLQNTSPNPVTVGTATFHFDDGSHNFDAGLSSAVTLPANGSDTLVFDSTIVDPNFTNTTYTPKVTISGGGIDSLLFGTITLPINSLSIFSARITTITGSKSKVARGETFTVDMTVRNDGPATINVDTAEINITPSLAATIIPISPPTQLPPNSSTIFHYDITVASNAIIRPYTADGLFQGTAPGGISVYDDHADNTFTFDVVGVATLDVQSLSPPIVTTGDQFQFTANVTNSGDQGVILDADSTYLKFGMDSISLKQSYSLPANNTVEITFKSDTINTPASATPYSPVIGFHGLENDAVFDTLAALSQTVLVQDPPDVQVTYIDVIPDTVSQNQDSILAQIILRNVGSLNATAQISTPNDISLIRTSSTQPNEHPEDYELGNFPIILKADSSSDTIDFIYSLSPSYLTGVDTARVSYSFADSNSSTVYPVSPQDNDTYLVQSRARLALVSTSITPDTVLQGQSGVQLTFTVRNTGEAPASIDSSDLSVQFNNPHALILNTPTPVVLAENGTQQFDYTMNIALNSIAPAYDYLDLTVSHTDVRSGKHYTDVQAANVDTIYIVEHASPSQLRAISVNTDFDSVSIGSDSVLVSARIKNNGINSITVDSLKLTFTRGIYQFSDTVFTPGIFLNGNQESIINLWVTVDSSSTPGVAIINMNAFGHGNQSGIFLQDLGADTADSWRLVTAAQLTFLSIAPDSMSNGQNVSFSAQVRNTGQANVHYNNAQTSLDFSGGPILVNQSGTIFGNSTKTLNFDTTTISLTPGVVPGSLNINNFIENGFSKSVTLSPVDIVVYDSASVTIQNVTLAQGTISQDMNLNMDVTLVNSGASKADAIIESISIPEFGYSKAIDSVLAADSSRTFSLDPFVSNAFSGNVPFNIDVYWQDRFIGGQNIVNSPQSVVVLNKANITITKIVNDTLVSRGQSGIPVDVTIYNSGEVDANIDSVIFTHLGFYTIHQPAYQDIPAMDSTVYNFQFDVDPNSGTGTDVIGVNISGKDSLSGNSIQANSSFTWDIETQSDVQILSVAPKQSQVSQGQTNIPVTVFLKNQGGERTQIDSLFLHFSNGDTNYTNRIAAPNLVLDQNEQDSVFFNNVGVSSNAPTGPVTIDASAKGHGLTSGNSIIIGTANVKGSWTVQKRPVITVPSLTISDDTVSTGQSNLVLSFQVANNGGVGIPTATAQIDSIHLVVAGNESDSTHFIFEPQFSTPFNLINSATLNLNYRITVRNAAQSGTYPFQAKVYYFDINDTTQLNILGSVSDTLIVQQKGDLVVDDITVMPDTAHVGQNNVEFTLTAKNNGEGTVQLNGANLKLPTGFIPSLQTLGFPFFLSQDSTVDILFHVNVPSITLPQFGDTSIFAGGIVQGVDLNSGTFLTDNQDSLASLTVVNQGDVVFDALTPSGPFANGDTVQFITQVTNAGGSIIHLNANTRLRLVKVDDPSTIIPINVDTQLSDLKIFPGEMTQLVFEQTLLAQTGDFRVIIEIRGTTNTIPYSQDVSTPTNIKIGGAVGVQSVMVNPDPVFPDQDSVEVTVTVLNAGLPLGIDSAQTFLEFKYADNNQPLAVLTERFDNLDSIPQSPPPVQLKWRFRVPADARTVPVNVIARLSLNNGNVTALGLGTFTISSGIDIDYLVNSISPNSIVPGQNVSFLSSFINRGNTTLLVDPDSSYIEFTDAMMHTFRAFVSGGFTIKGTQDTIPDTSLIVFKPGTIDPAFIPGVSNITFHMEGTLPSGEDSPDYDATFPNQITILQEANLLVDSIDILLTTVFPGQNDVEVRYYLRNSGNSPGSVTGATSIFVDDLGSDITGSWTPVFQSPPFPFTIAGQNSATLTRRFNVSTSIDSNVVRAYAFLNGQYNDTRKPGDLKTFSDSTVFDSVNVIQQSTIFVESLVLTNVPNDTNGTVNWLQPFDLALALRNSGQDTLRDAVVELFRIGNPIPVSRDTLPGLILPDSTASLTYNLSAGLTSTTQQYRADLVQAISVTSGLSVPIGQPIDNTENVIVQRPSILKLFAFAEDSSLSVSQQFQVDFQISRTGQSPIDTGLVRINLPSNYSLPTPSDSLRPINQNLLSGSWDVIANGVTTGPDDTIKVDYFLRPIDKNIGLPVAVINTEATIPVRTGNLGQVQVTSITITEPAGARDDTISTNQTFRLKAIFNFIGPVSQNNRQAELVLPLGAGFFADSTIQTLTSDSAVWQIRAPDAVQALTKAAGENGEAERSAESRQRNSKSRLIDLIEGVQGQLFDLQVIGRAMELNTGSVITDTSSHQVQVQNRAQVEVQSEIVSPPGAIDGILSADQPFDVKVYVTNTGEAQTKGNNQVVLRVPVGFNIQGSQADSITLSIPTGLGFAQTVRIFAPDTATGGPVNLPVSIDSAALDENSNLPSFVSQRLQNVRVNVVNKASLRIDNLATSQDSLSRDQGFTVSANIFNTGQAAVLPNDSVRVQIEFNPANFQLAVGEALRKSVKLVGNAAMVSWQMRTTPSANFGNQTLSAFIDSLYSRDENTDTLAFIEKVRDFHTVMILDQGQVAIQTLVFPDSGTSSVVVSTDQDSIRLQMTVSIPQFFGKAQAAITLPAGFSADSLVKHFQPGDTVQWFLTAPPQSVDSIQIIKVKATATSDINPEITRSDSAYGNIKVERKANLSISSRIVAPPGAIDGILSSDQRFDVRIWVVNSGVAQTNGNNQIIFSVPPGFDIQGSPTDTTITLFIPTGPGSADTVRIFAPDSAIAGQDSLQASILSAALDENTNQPAFVSQAQRDVPVNVVNKASLIIDGLTAIPDSLTLDQKFDVTANISNTGQASVKNNTVWVEVKYDTNNFQLDTTETALKAVQLFGSEGEVTWQMHTTLTANFGSDTLTAFIIDTLSFDENSDSSVFVQKGSDTASVLILDQGEVEVQTLLFPNGKDSLVASTDQSGIRLMLMANIPSYFSNPTATIILPTGAGFSTDSSLVKPVRPDGSVQWFITAPSQSRDRSRFIVEVRAVSNINGEISIASDNAYIRVEQKANLSISGEITAPPGATDGIISYGQAFTYQALVTKSGEAGLSDSVQGTIEIQLGNLLQIADGSPAVKPFDIGTPVEWQVKADSSAAAKMILRQIKQLHPAERNLSTNNGIFESSFRREDQQFGRQASEHREDPNEDIRFDPIRGEGGESVNDELNLLYEQLSALTDSSSVTVRIQTIPFDVNTGDSAFVSQRDFNTPIIIEEEAFLNVETLDVGHQNWSTQQIDTVEASISKSPQITIQSANIVLPQGFSNLGVQFQDSLYRWIIQTPPSIPVETVYPIEVRFVGIDQNSADTFRDTLVTTITVQQQAELKLKSNVYSLRVSQNQKFTISATILNDGEAGITNIGYLELNPGQMQLDSLEVAEKQFSSVPTVISWNLVAPDSNVNTLVTVRFSQRPLDANKGLPVALNPDSSRIVVDVNMIPKRLFARKLGDISPNSNYVQGSQNIKALGIGLKNPETTKEDTIYVRQFLISVRDPQNNDQRVANVSNLISRIKVVNYNSLSQFGKLAGEPSLFADIPVDANTANPIVVDFSVFDTVGTGESDKLVVLADIASNAPNKNFVFKIDNISAFQEVGGADFTVEVTDSIGNPVNAIQLESLGISVVSADPELNFGNYPNPFGLDDKITKFVFLMESPGNAELMIYTLLGELVWKEEVNDLPAGLHDGAITWDGYNGVGNLALNGIYLAVLKVNYANGQSKTYKTKVAFIK